MGLTRYLLLGTGATTRAGADWRVVLRPTTTPGRWTLVSIGGFGALLAGFVLLVASGQRGGDEFFDNLWLAVPFLLAYACAVAAAVLGCVAIVRRRERSAPVMLATLVGLLVTAFGVLEVAFPH